jgi:hypothetical protein
MSEPFEAEVEVDTVIVVDKYGVDEEYNQKTHPGIHAKLTTDPRGVVYLLIGIPIDLNNSPQTRQAPRV